MKLFVLLLTIALFIQAVLIGAETKAHSKPTGQMNKQKICLRVELSSMSPHATSESAKSDICQFTTDIMTDPAEIITIKSERLKLSPEPPNAWMAGTGLRQICTLEPGRGTGALNALDPESLVLHHKDSVLELGRDYLLDEVWGCVGMGPNSRVTTQDEITADYSYSLLRVDSLIRNANDIEEIVKGQSHLTIPLPPGLTPGQKRLANIFVDYHSDGRNVEAMLVLEDADQAKTQTTLGRIPKSMARIKSGGPIKIVCWGDSVTCGGDASSPEHNYTAVFENKLRQKFPNADITIEVIAVGGSNSRQWLYPEPGDTNRNWQNIIDAKPDLITIEFVNDSYLNQKEIFNETYQDILIRLNALKSEVIFITPHFTRGMPRDKDGRGYVSLLKEFAHKHNLALADASARWEHLYKEGLPYITLLRNAFNHPDDRGHMIFSEELIKCFGNK